MSTPHQICQDVSALVTANLSELLSLRATRTQKADESYVTKADLLIQDLIYGYFKDKHPNYTVVSEEMDNSNFQDNPGDHFAVLDPIDGTENFTSGLVEWGVGLSLYRAGTHACSMILLPELGKSLTTGDTIKRFESRIHGISSSLGKDDLKLLERGFEYRMIGCSMYNMYNVVHGSYAVFENIKGVNTWDLLPGINLALEHGCEVEIDGQPYEGQFLPPTKKYRVKVRSR